MAELGKESKVERVRKSIKEAFAAVPCPDSFKQADSCVPVTHDVAMELRQDFYNYEPKELQYMLPSILEDAMDTHPGDDIETDGIEMLVLQLNPFSIDEPVIRANRLNQFANFTQSQAGAICEWLRLARTWNDLKLYTDWVDSAIDYWCNRGSN